MNALIVQGGGGLTEGGDGRQFGRADRQALQFEGFGIDLKIALVCDRMPCGVCFDLEVAGVQGYTILILEHSLAVGDVLALVLECDARFAEQAGEMAAERTRRHRAIADQFIDVARIEAGGAGPGVQFAALRYSHLEAHAIGGFELKRIVGAALPAGCIAAGRLALGPRRSFTWHHALIVAAVHGFDAHVLLEIVGHRLKPRARLLQHDVGIVRGLALGYGDGNKQEGEFHG